MSAKDFKIGFVGVDRMVTAGLGELDKSGIAELTFRGRSYLSKV